MLILRLLLPVVVAGIVRTLRVGAGAEYTTLDAALAASRAGDTLQLADSHYELAHTLVVNHALTIETAPELVAAVLRSTSSDVDVVVAINANDVTLRNLIFGRSVNERTIDVFVSAGTQQQQSTIFAATSNYGGSAAAKKATRAVSTRLLSNSAVTADDNSATNRAIRDFTIENVDFTASTSASNLAFDTGAYIGVHISRCKFGTRDLTDAIITVPGARFADSAPLTFNAFDKARLNLAGNGLTLGTNFWASARPPLAATYCVDRHCTLLGPVVDADEPTAQAYGTIAQAIEAGVRNVLVTAASVEWGILMGPIFTEGTTVRGVTQEHCSTDGDAVPLVKLTVGVVSTGISLVAVSDLRFELGEGMRDAAFNYIDSASEKTPAGDVLFERVTMLADDETQTLLTLNSRSVSLTLARCALVAGGTGVRLASGAIVVSDTLFLSQHTASVLVTGSGSGTGLRVSGSEFSGSPSGSIVFARSVSSASMLPISISCSRFVYAPFVEPADCMRNAQQCANALRYNTFIELLEPTPMVANRRFLAHGNNHVERVVAAEMSDFTSLAHNGGSAFAFSFVDKQGRFGRVRADVALQSHAANQFVYASNVPMRQECFAESVPGQRVVSGLFSLTTDAPARCISLALQFTVVADDADNSTASTADDVAVYDVKHLGNTMRGSAIWARAASNAVLQRATTNSFVVEASSGAGALLQAVVVAQKLTARENATLLAAGESVVPRASQRFCVACGGDTLPAYVVDERCGGGVSGAHVFTDFDAAIVAANEAGRGGDTVVLLVYGSKCTTASCNTRLLAQSMTLEGFSVSQQSALRRPASCAVDMPMLTLAAPSITVRYMLLAATQALATAVPRCAVELAQNDCRVSFCTLSGGVCANDADAQIVGNEISASPVAQVGIVASADSSNTLVQANVFTSGMVTIEHRARGARIDRNTFNAHAELLSAGEVTLTGNTFADRVADQSANAACITSMDESSAFTSTGDVYGGRCRLLLAGPGKIRISGLKSAVPWVNVQLKLSETSDVRVANIDLRGADSQVVLVDPGAKNVVLYDVGIDLEMSTLGDTLLGRPLARTPCSGDNEPALGGFALAQSLLLDARSRRALLGGSVPKLKASEFISPLDGSVVRCSSAPEAEYCRCIAAEGVPLTTTTRATKQPTTPTLPVDVAAVGTSNDVKPPTSTTAEEPLLVEEPLDDIDAGLDAVLPQTLARAVKKVLPQSVRKYKVAQDNSHNHDHDNDGDHDGDSHHHGDEGMSAGWIVGIVLITLFVLLLICIACCFCYPGFSSTTRTTRRVVEEGDGSETITETVTTTANRRRKASTKSPGRQASSFGVVLDSSTSSSSSSVSESNGIKLRKVTQRIGKAEDV